MWDRAERLVYPVEFNVGLAPPAPRGALALAPRVAAVMPSSMAGRAYPRMSLAFSYQPIAQWQLPFTSGTAGPVFRGILNTALIPNPYQPSPAS